MAKDDSVIDDVRKLIRGGKRVVATGRKVARKVSRKPEGAVLVSGATLASAQAMHNVDQHYVDAKGNHWITYCK